MKWFLNVLFLFAVKSVYSKSIQSSMQDNSKEVNDFLSKILNADKFNELADRIADRAVKKISDYQKPQFKAKLFPNDGLHRSNKNSFKEEVNYSIEKSIGKAKHNHGKIDVDAVLKKTVLPLDDLKLRYTYLKNKHAKAGMEATDKDDEEAGLHEINFNMNLKEGNKGNENNSQDYQKLAQDIQFDFDENIKTISDENFQNPYGDGQTVSWNKKESKYLHKAEKRLRNETISGTTRTEGDKQFAHLESPDYKEYNDQLANVESS